MAQRITESLKWDIVNAYDNQNDTQAIAQMMGISRRSVQRVLNEKGVFGRKQAPKQASAAPTEPVERAPRYELPRRQSVEVTDDQLHMLELLQQYGQTAASLELVLKAPALTPDNVRLHLAKMSAEEIGNFFYSAVVTKIAVDYRAQQDTAA